MLGLRLNRLASFPRRWACMESSASRLQAKLPAGRGVGRKASILVQDVSHGCGWAKYAPQQRLRCSSFLPGLGGCSALQICLCSVQCHTRRVCVQKASAKQPSWNRSLLPFFLPHNLFEAVFAALFHLDKKVGT